MTTIVGYLDGNLDAWIGADRLAVMAPTDRKCLESVAKIVQAGPWLIGVAGPAVIQRSLLSRVETISEMEHAGQIGDLIMSLIRESNWKPHEPEGSAPHYDVEAVIARAGQLWHYMPDGLVEPVDEFVAIGAGEDYAFGAYHALTSEDAPSGGAIVGAMPLLQVCLAAAERFSPWSGRGCNILVAPNDWVKPS